MAKMVWVALIVSFAMQANANELADYIDQISSQPSRSLHNSPRWQASDQVEYQACRADFDEMFADGVLKMSLTFGYLDWPSQNRVIDQEAFEDVYQTLTRPCRSSTDFACGFARIYQPYRSAVTL